MNAPIKRLSNTERVGKVCLPCGTCPIPSHTIYEIKIGYIRSSKKILPSVVLRIQRWSEEGRLPRSIGT